MVEPLRRVASVALDAYYQGWMKLAHRPWLAFAVLLFACGTDNGPNTFGPTYGPGGARDAGRMGTSSSGGLADGGPTPLDDAAAPDGDDGGANACTQGRLAVLAGDDGSLSGAQLAGSGSWSGVSIAGGAALSRPALAAFGQGFLGVARGVSGALQSTMLTTTWSAASSFGVAGVKGPPALAVAGTSAHVVYSAGPGGTTEFMHGIDAGSGWNAARPAPTVPKE